MSSKTYEENGYSLDLELVIILYYNVSILCPHTLHKNALFSELVLTC